MNHYELLYLIDVPGSEEDQATINQRVTALISENEGSIVHQESLGRRKLAYTIDKRDQGVYHAIEFDLPGTNLNKINQALRLDTDIIRSQVIRIKPRTEADRKQVSLEIEERTDKKPEKKKLPSPTAAPQPKPEERDAPPVSQEELDRRLDEILDQDIIKE